MGLFTKSFVVDLGTSTTQVYERGAGVVLDEPSIVAMDKPDGKIVAVGNAAMVAAEKNPDSIIITKPLLNGAVADYDITRSMIKSFLRKCPAGIAKPQVSIIVPGGITEVEKRAVKEAFLSAGAKAVSFADKALMCAHMSGVAKEMSGSMIIDIGGGTTELALFSFGGVVSSRSIRVGGDNFDSAIREYIRKNYDMIIGIRSAEHIKRSLDSVGEGDVAVNGRDIKSGLPKTVFLCSAGIMDAMRSCITEISDAAGSMLQDAPADLALDIKEKGILITGGGGRLSGLCGLLGNRLNMPVHYREKDPDFEKYLGGK